MSLRNGFGTNDDFGRTNLRGVGVRKKVGGKVDSNEAKVSKELFSRLTLLGEQVVPRPIGGQKAW